MKVSIIMPCYNVEKTIIRALDSIIKQKVTFEYEVIVVDDCSTDNTLVMVSCYAKSYPQVKLICNDKNQGNAHSYYVGLCAARGDYFCVLDGDDYYTISDKLQRQVDFLESDVKTEYVGTATQYIIDLGDNTVSIPDRSVCAEFTYADFLTQNSGYYHTATYMYRNIFRGNVPACFSETLYRGDTPRTMFHLMYSGKKIKVLDFVGSAYTFEYTGIWSGLKQKEQFEYQVNYQMKHKENVTTAFEREAADRLINFNREKMFAAQDDLRRYPSITIEQALASIGHYAGKFAFMQKEFTLKHVYRSLYLDTLCASLGYIDGVRNPDHLQQSVNNENVCIFNGVLNPKGGGIFVEIDELIEIYDSKNVFLFVTDMEEVPSEAKSILAHHNNLSILCPPKNIEKRLEWFRTQIAKIAPYRSYFYCSHKDAYAAALIQESKGENITLFSFDHGFLCGILNPSIDIIVAKRPTDYWMLKKELGDRVILIPAWSKGAQNCEEYEYEPFNEHDQLITASGAARFYKIDGKPPYRYIDMIVSLLQETKGVHYHFGELPECFQKEINEKLCSANIQLEKFIHISWAENIPLELLKNHVDVFIEPFPVVSYKLTLEVLSVGIPIIAWNGFTRMEITDFVPEGTMFWRDKAEFLSLLTGLERETLKDKSMQCLKCFEMSHSMKAISGFLHANRTFPIAEKRSYPDDTLNEITDSLRVYGNNFRISIMGEIVAQEREKKRLEDVECQKILSREQIMLIRSSKRFKLGFALTLPLRFVKQFSIRTLKKGPIKGIKEIKEQKLMSYVRADPREELYVLKNSAAFCLGEHIASICDLFR